ncbi:ABC transporter substrate-binding protein [Pseudoclavibacter chungangensis]|uniref:ABC transporter substrate-binding protein n=1 Tax=Pseudoclavibacter chungangensis TaxID=587635 RepID=A0A7J5BRY3_9MICO|nr:ABC transporter substrate-binding protein [Pseudoclavibacter chungangensis]KAB1655373.1 ABC transporter substrate-binding protein [Pseudoclavibacter chungangensis]NYJ68324.1 iron complex transport system substrate-binding protein [Pseudoclavibacter chungangensis]
MPRRNHATSTTRPRISTAISGLLVAITALTGCAGGATDSNGAEYEVEDGAFPVTIDHAFGSTTIERAPVRVVSVGYNEQDALLALGVVPVGVTDWFGDDTPGRIYPWALDALGDAPLPEVLNADDGVQLEKVAALEPDLIIGQYAGITEDEYEQLSRIAPTVVQPGDYAEWGAPWDVATLNIGSAVGKPAAAQALVDEVRATLDTYADEHAELFAGQTGVNVATWEGVFVYGPEDPRGRLLTDLGIGFPENLLTGDSEEFGWSISPEKAGELNDVGVVIWGATEQEVEEAVGRIWFETDAAKEGRAIYASPDESAAFVTASNFVTPLSMPYYLERFMPQLVAALDGDPATEVPVVTE